MSTRLRGTDDGWTEIEVPSWLAGWNPGQWFQSASFEFRQSEGKSYVRLLRTSAGTPPSLLRVHHLYRTGSFNRLGLLSGQSELTTISLTPEHRRRLGKELAAEPPESEPSWLASLLYRLQLRLSPAVSQPEELPRVAAAALREVEAAILVDGGKRSSLFPTVGLSLVKPNTVLLKRLKYPSVLLRQQHDHVLAAGSTKHLERLLGDGKLAFASSEALFQGFYLLEPYLSPLMGSVSPSVWAVPAVRTFGTLVTTLGRAVAGTVSQPAYPLEVVAPNPSAVAQAYEAPNLYLDGQLAALEWWVEGLDRLFSVLTDYANFTGSSSLYQPGLHLNAIGTVDQLFRRVSSILMQGRDNDARLALLYSCIDTLEWLNGRDLVRMFKVSHARKTLASLEADIPPIAHDVLLPAVRRSVAALEGVQEGFFMAAQRGSNRVDLPSGPVELETAASKLLHALRNATHGYGGQREKRPVVTALLANHNGHIPGDLPSIALLYVMDLFRRPDQLEHQLRRKDL